MRSIIPDMDVVLEAPAAVSWDFPRDDAGVELLVGVGAEHGVAREQMLRGTGLDPDELGGDEHLVTARQELQVVRNLCRAVPDVSGLDVGVRYRVTTFGVFGFALLSSRTLGDAANLAMRFIDLSFAFAIPRPAVVGEEVVVGFDSSGLPADVADFLAARDLGAVWSVLDQLCPGGVRATAVELAARRPAGGASYDLGVEPVHDAPATRLAFDVALLDTPLPSGTGQGNAMTTAMCADLVSRRRARTGTAQQTRVLIAQHLANGAPMAAVAADLALGERSLRRRLAAEGTSYQQLLDEVRESLAVQLLETGVLSVEDVAQRLGYAEASSFIVAFRRWRGTTPTAYLVGVRAPTG